MYSIKLLNYAFDDTYSNVRLFKDKVSRETYFDDAIGITQKVINFNAGNLLSTQIVFDAPESEPLQKLLNKNYAVVKLLDEDEGVSSKNETLYFHIKRSRQASDNRIICDLEIDFFMTYWYDIEFSDCLIARSHLDRFIKNPDGSYSFDGRAVSNLFEREDIKELSKRLVTRKKLILHSDLNPEIADFINKNIICWVYISMDSGAYKVGSYGSQTEIRDDELIKTRYVHDTQSVTTLQEPKDAIESPCTTLVYPIYKTNSNTIYGHSVSSLTYLLSANAFQQFLAQNGGYTSNIKAIKLSPKPPFELEKYKYNYSISNGNLILEFEQNPFSGDSVFDATPTGIIQSPTTTITTNQPAGMLIYLRFESLDSYVKLKLDNFDLPQLKFNKNEIIGSNKNIKFNPKLNNADYKSLTLSFFGSNYDFDIQKLNSSNPIFKLREIVGPDISKMLITLDIGNNNDIFTEAFTNGFTGLILTNDLSIPVSNDVFNEFLANNKNAYISFQNQQNYNITKNLISSVAGFSKSAMVGKPVQGAVDVIENMAQTLNTTIYNEAQFNLTLDNMRSAPDKLINANGSAVFGSAISEFGIYAEFYSALESELKIANDYAYENGYYFNQYGNIKNFVSTRKYFNYIEAVPDNIIGNISNEIKSRIKLVLSQGVRFWHVDKIDYSKENYEIILEE